jgi:membrane fusion protein (multidrug efflux system)
MQAQETAPEKKPGNGKRRLFVLLTIGLIAVGIFVFLKIRAAGHEQTDNAQLDAMITPIRNIVPGFITAIHFEDNQQVQKDEVLIEIDQQDYKARVAQAEAALESAKAQLEMARTGASVAKTNANSTSLSSAAIKDNIKSQQALVTRNEQELARLDKMLKDGSATRQQYEATVAETESSKAKLEMLQKEYDASTSQTLGAKTTAEGKHAEIELAEAVIKQRESELQLAQTQLANTLIKAPYDGIVSKKSVEMGQYLQAGVPVCSVVDFNHLWLSANFKETQIEDIRVGQDVRIKLDAFPHSRIKGRVESFGGATGAKFSLLPPDNATGNFVKITQRVPVRIAITDYPEELKGMLLPGLSAVADVLTK